MIVKRRQTLFRLSSQRTFSAKHATSGTRTYCSDGGAHALIMTVHAWKRKRSHGHDFIHAACKSYQQLTCKPAFHRGKVFSPVEPKHSKTPGEEIRPIIDEVGVEFERLLHMVMGG